MNGHHIATIEPAAKISPNLVNILNRVAGHVFDNNNIKIEFLNVRPDAKSPISSITFQLNHQGVEAQGYVSPQTIQRLLGVNLHYLEPEYIVYLFSQKAARYGVNNICYVQELSCDSLPFIDALFFVGDFTIQGALNAKTLLIDSAFLNKKKREISRDIKLSVCYSPFETALHTKEISDLSKDDIVLVYPK